MPEAPPVDGRAQPGGPVATIPASPRSRRWGLAGILLAAAVLGCLALCYALLTRAGGGTDEDSHLGYVASLLHGSLPGAGVRERQQPPGYYLIEAAIAHLDDSLGALRAVSIVIGMMAVVATGWTARRLWPDHPLRWTAVALIAAALPEVQWLSGTVTNDPMAQLAAALLTLAIVAVATSEPSTALMAGIGAAIALGLLAKETDYSLIVILMALCLLRWRGGLLQPATALIAVIPAVCAGWWYARNLAAFHSPLPPLAPLANSTTVRHLTTLSQVPTLVHDTFQSLFGFFLSGSHAQPIGFGGNYSLLFHCLEVMSIIAIAGGAVIGYRERRTLMRRRALTWALLACPLGAGAALLANDMIVDFQPQGRYLLVALPAVALLLVGAASHVWSWWPRGRWPLATGAVMAAAALDAAGIDTIIRIADRM